MPSFTLNRRSAGPVEAVWKLLHDPTRFPDWWQGVETVAVRTADPDSSAYTMWPAGYPDFPMEQRLDATPGRVTISCLVSELIFVWRLREDGSGTEIEVTVELPEREARRLDDQRRLIEESLLTLARLAVDD
ncbi:SRPBCC family protein [Microlunatus speluncae]|uniref:SRPBCC family protein n=1 Tax=Microlunatus speluncae TaxID=2594267 RepID=UPI0012664F10|nr:SRPBCC family protein [Microlunatus speluncae]